MFDYLYYVDLFFMSFYHVALFDFLYYAALFDDFYNVAYLMFYIT